MPRTTRRSGRCPSPSQSRDEWLPPGERGAASGTPSRSHSGDDLAVACIQRRRSRNTTRSPKPARRSPLRLPTPNIPRDRDRVGEEAATVAETSDDDFVAALEVGRAVAPGVVVDDARAAVEVDG